MEDLFGTNINLINIMDNFNVTDLTLTPVTDTLDAAITAGDTTVQFTASGTADLRNNNLFKVQGEIRTIIDDDGAGVYTVNKSFDGSYDNGSTIYYVPRFLTLDVGPAV